MSDAPPGDVTLTIQDVAFGGQGVGRLPDGRVVFVPRTLNGEVVRARPVRAHRNFVEAELAEVLEASPHRVPPPCPYFGACGGCAYQHASYAEQLRMKEKQVHDILMRIGKLKAIPPPHIEAAAETFGYRNKIVVHRGDDGELGFYAADQHRVVDIERCLIATEVVNQKLADLRRQGRKPSHASLVDPVDRDNAPAGSFYQVNAPMARRVRDWVRGQMTRDGLPSSDLLELYCGSGFFALELADVFEKVCGVDRDERAIHAAVARARREAIRHAQFLAADVTERIGWLLDAHAGRPTTVLVDPPREGLSRRTVEALAATPNLVRLIYVSCDPSTLARDLKGLLAAVPSTPGSGKPGLSWMGLFDMFPQTAHIEVVASIERLPDPKP